MRGTQVQYMGFTAGETRRQYNLRVRRPDGEVHSFTVSIPSAAFVARRVTYQQGPEICYRKLERELLECGDDLPALNMNVTDAELEDFRLAQMPRSKQRRTRAPGTS